MSSERELFSVNNLPSSKTGSPHFLTVELTPPSMIYKYYGNIDYAIDAIENQRIHLENPAFYNDLYDSVCRLTETDISKILCDRLVALNIPYMINISTDREYIERYMGLLRQLKDFPGRQVPLTLVVDCLCENDITLNRTKIIEDIVLCMPKQGLYTESHVKVSCFSERNDSLLMWGYYANSYKGVCIGFETSKDATLKHALQKVRYSEDIGTNLCSTDYLFRKSREWEHEQEWRIVSDNNIEYLPTDSVTSIILGPRIERNNLERMVLLAEKYKLALFYMQQMRTQFKLKVNQFTL